jgi:hypothetical protein
MVLETFLFRTAESFFLEAEAPAPAPDVASGELGCSDAV